MKNSFFCNHRNRRKKQPQFQFRQLVRTADFKRVFSTGDSTIWSYKLYIITQLLTRQFLHIESTIYPSDIIKTY